MEILKDLFPVLFEVFFLGGVGFFSSYWVPFFLELQQEERGVKRVFAWLPLLLCSVLSLSIAGEAILDIFSFFRGLSDGVPVWHRLAIAAPVFALCIKGWLMGDAKAKRPRKRDLGG